MGDDKLVYTYMPTIIEYYLGEKPLLANVDTFRCWLDDEREEVLDRVDELVIKPVEGSGGYGIVFGPEASTKELNAISKSIRDDPRGWIAQPMMQLSTVPTQVGDTLTPRYVDLRPFAVNDGDDVWVLPGGLTRVALVEGSRVVNSSQGGGSKDTWVLASRTSGADRELGAAEVVKKLPKAGRVVQRRSGRRKVAVTKAIPAAAADESELVGNNSRVNSSSYNSRWRFADARPQCRSTVLDRPLRRARRRHGTHPRRHGAPVAGGFQRRPRPHLTSAVAGLGN